MRRFQCALLAAVAVIGFASVASAADMPVKAPVAPVAVPYNWTGFYVGANIGGGWGSRSVDYTANDPLATLFLLPAVSFNTSGVIGGLQLGYNWQFNRNWLIGIETDFDGSGMKGPGSSSGNRLDQNPFTATVDEHIKWFGTVRARLGYLPADNLLAYVTGGLAYGRVEHTGSYVNNNSSGFSITNTVGGTTFNVTCNGNVTCFTGSSSSMATGWTLGGGLEYAVWQHWTLRAEYLYVSLYGKSVTETALASPGNTPASFNANYSRTNFNVARVGVNYRF